MFIDEYFDPSNNEHLKALYHMQWSEGWPEGFLPEDIKFRPGWRMMIYSKIIDFFLKEKGIPEY